MGVGDETEEEEEERNRADGEEGRERTLHGDH